MVIKRREAEFSPDQKARWNEPHGPLKSLNKMVELTDNVSEHSVVSILVFGWEGWDGWED